MTRLEREELYRLKEEQAQRQARQTLLAFTTYTKKDYDVNWHHRVLCHYLDRFIVGEIKRLIVIMPPRHGKSELVSRRLPSYIFGKKPDAKVIACSYSADLARMMNRDCQRIMDGPEYLRLFPETTLFGKNIRTVAHGTALRNSEIFEIVDREGQYRASGIGGGITGMGADYAIIDDPIKNQQEADSEVYRNNVWDWYTSTLYTRLEKDDHVLLTLTRWNEDDLAGRLMELQRTDPKADKWVVLHFPAIKTEELSHEEDIRENGEALWPRKYDLERLEKIKAVGGSYVWSGLYQGTPSGDGGNIFKRKDFRWYKVLPKYRARVIQSWDTAFKKDEQNDYSVCVTWLESEQGYYILNVHRERLEFPELIKVMKEMFKKWKPDGVYVEDKASGQSAIQTLERKTKIPILPRGSDKDKVAKWKAVSAHVEAGNVYLPEDGVEVPDAKGNLTDTEWLHDFIKEVTGVPNTKFDDQADAFQIGLKELTDGIGTWEDEVEHDNEMLTSDYEREMANV